MTPDLLKAILKLAIETGFLAKLLELLAGDEQILMLLVRWIAQTSGSKVPA